MEKFSRIVIKTDYDTYVALDPEYGSPNYERNPLDAYNFKTIEEADRYRQDHEINLSIVRLEINVTEIDIIHPND